jgi:hypothetical protein
MPDHLNIAILLILRDCESYIPYLIHKFDEMESYYKDYINFTYLIYENDSSDNTLKKLRDFSESHKYKNKVKLITEKLHTKNISSGICLERINRIAYIRNKALNTYIRYIVKTNYTLFIDSHIYFEVDYIHKMINASKKYGGASIITCNTLDMDAYDSNIDAKETEDVEDVEDVEEVEDADTIKTRDVKLKNPSNILFNISLNSTSQHYYDTFAYVSKDGHLLFPKCPNPLCKEPTCINEYKWSTKINNIVEAKSAWGGFVLIDSTAFHNENIKWEVYTIEEAIFKRLINKNNIINQEFYKTNKNNAVCEHISFCKSIQLSLNKPCIIVTDIMPYWTN